MKVNQSQKQDRLEKLEPGVALVSATGVGSQLSPVLERLIEEAQTHATEARAQATRDAYEYQFERFERWCEAKGLVAFPATPGAVAIYITDCAKTLKRASISLALSAITSKHRKEGLATPCSHPTVKAVWEGISRKLTKKQVRKDPLKIDAMRELLKAAPVGILGDRDRALLAVGFAGGFRRSELVAMNVEDLNFVRGGVEILVRRSKTDQEGEGLTKIIALGNDEATCPVRLLRRWLETSDIETGPVFCRVDRHENVGEKALTGQVVADIVKRTAKRAGIKPEPLSGHSLRAGFVTEAHTRGADDKAIMDQTGHKSVETLYRYIRRVDQWEKPASAKLGL